MATNNSTDNDNDSTTERNRHLEDVPTAMSTSGLQNKLRQLKEQSSKHSQLLTAKLASSQSGQNLLHIGTSLSTLPPDLHSLLTQLHPVLSATESTEKNYLGQLTSLVENANQIRTAQRRVEHAQQCAQLYQELVAAENVVAQSNVKSQQQENQQDGENEEDQLSDHTSSLERCAHTTLCLVQELQSSTDKLSILTSSTPAASAGREDGTSSMPSLKTPLPEDTERAQFLLKLAPRIRKLEMATISRLAQCMEDCLGKLQQQPNSVESLLLMLGNCMRGLALLGRSKEVENIFARVAIMPLIRSKVSMGRLDEGGSRGECAGLFSLLDDITTSITQTFGPALRLSEGIFDISSSSSPNPSMDVDLVTAGVWVPIATALMADAGIKMAIFSPGIASILQQNYVALDTFLSELAGRLLLKSTSNESDGIVDDESNLDSVEDIERLYFKPTTSMETIRRAQDRIYAHPKTAEFSKKWNLPIYYQLRFGDCCNRLNKAVEDTRQGGWVTDVFSGTPESAEQLKQSMGFELSFFLELYDILLGLWRPDVVIRPLTNRFLRGAVQMLGRSVAFIKDGMDGRIKFGVEPQPVETGENGSAANGTSLPYPTRSPYCWGESAQDVAAVAWELAILETSLSHDYVSTVCAALVNSDSSENERAELGNLVSEILKDATGQIPGILDRAWNELIVNILIGKCSGPLSAVKGVAATYRMTNRPPPTQASPYVRTILRPLKEFNEEFSSRLPHQIGEKWKHLIISDIAKKYSVAVEELITTVQRTETALQNRRTQRRVTSGGISDGEKVKLQVFLDFQQFSHEVEELCIDPSSVDAIQKLRDLTAEAAQLQQRAQNGV